MPHQNSPAPHHVRGLLFRMETNGADMRPTEILLDVTGDPMTVYERGRDAVKAIHADQGLDPTRTQQMIAHMGRLVDSPPPAPGRQQQPLIVMNKPSGLMWTITP